MVNPVLARDVQVISIWCLSMAEKFQISEFMGTTMPICFDCLIGGVND